MAKEGVQFSAKKMLTSVFDIFINVTAEIGNELIELLVPDEPVVQPLSHQQRAIIALSHAQTLLRKSQPGLFVKKPFKQELLDFHDFKNKLIVSGVRDRQLEQKLRDKIIYYLTHIEGGKKLLESTVSKGEVTINFTSDDRHVAYWDINNRIINIQFNGNFLELLQFLSKPPKVHIISCVADFSLPQTAVDSIIFEFHNAALFYKNSIASTLSANPLLFKKARDYSCVMEYLEFYAQTKGNGILIQLSQYGKVEKQNFNQYFEIHSTQQGLYKNHSSHSAIYEGRYHDHFNKNEKRLLNRVRQ